jgi:hypothetical protein
MRPLFARGGVQLLAAMIAAFAAMAVIALVAHPDTNQGFYAGNWPQADWRPFAGSSPFNQQLPASPRLASNSSAWAGLIGGTPNAIHSDIGGQSYYTPTYWTQSSDPTYRIQGSCCFTSVQAPQGITTASGSDASMTVIVGNYHYAFGNCRVNNSTRLIYPASGSTCYVRRGDLGGSGVGGNSNSTGLGCGLDAAGFCNLSGRIRAQELLKCRINHALDLTTSKTSSSFVYPAVRSDGGTSGGIPEGSRVQYDPSFDPSGLPCYKRAVVTALQHYGGFVSDTSGAPYFAFAVESDVQYTSLTNPRTGAKFLPRLPIVARNNGVSGDLTFSGVDWRRLRVIAVCVTQKTC